VKTKPLPVIATLDEIERKAKQAFVDTQRELARIARARIDGDATEQARTVAVSKSRTE